MSSSASWPWGSGMVTISKREVEGVSLFAILKAIG